MSLEYFKISSGLKNLIGRELITDNFVAVFELVKNSFDANANEVKITFRKVYSENAKIIIQDDGKGMDYDDLINKWLFLAYSAKKDGSEDSLGEQKDYRNDIDYFQKYAGAKGVGRFSCDRLGKFLNLISIKNIPNARIENLKINWQDFEIDQKKEFATIPVTHEVLDSTEYSLDHGTILEITGIDTNDWNRDSFLRLKDRLSKLIRPELNQQFENREFRIILEVPDEAGEDSKIIEKAQKNRLEESYIYSNTVNGSIRNFVFEELDERTTKITTTIEKDGTRITTTLFDRGVFIYRIVERNNYDLLKHVSLTLYFLNQSSKNIFKRRVGVNSVDYGSIFVYKNGFRIYPYGERGDDSLGIDNRALQQYARQIGLRQLMGQFNIQGENQELREATSRDAGLVKTKTFYQLADTSPYSDSLLLKTLKRLEKFAVEVTQWGINDDQFDLLEKSETKEALAKLISNVSDDKSVLSLEYNQDIVDLLDQKEEKSAKKLLSNFKRIAAESNDPKLIKDAAVLENRISQQSKILESQSKELVNIGREANQLKVELEEQVGETMFARAVVNSETKELLSIQHHIYRHAAQHVSHYIDRLMTAVNNDEPKEKLLDLTNKIAFENKKIITLSRFVTKANFDTTTTKIREDLIAFVNQYVLNVYKEYKHIALNNQKIDIRVLTPKGLSVITSFKPIEIIIILDNLLNNAFKADASEVLLSWYRNSSDEILLDVKDNGNGILEKNLDKIFEFRFSTTDGSGLGLYHAKDTIEKMGGQISVKNNKDQNGATFTLTFKK